MSHASSYKAPSPPSLVERKTNPRLGWLFVALVLVGLCAVPLVASDYVLFQLSTVIVYAIGVLGLNLLVGYNGQISLGHGAIFAIGAYTSAILQDQYGVNYVATVPIAGAVCLVFGLLFGLPALRLAGLHLALATFALALAVPQLLRYEGLTPFTGGTAGITLSKPDAPAGLPLDPDQWLYFLTLGVAVLMFLGAWNLLRGRIGRAIIAIREHPLAASSVGVNLALFKTATFGISAAYMGVAGALSAILVQFVGPDSYDLFLSISFLVGAAVGGLATFSGAIFGAIFIVFVPDFASRLSDSAPWAIYGIVLIGVMYLMPTGLAGLFPRVAKALRRRREASAAPQADLQAIPRKQ